METEIVKRLVDLSFEMGATGSDCVVGVGRSRMEKRMFNNNSGSGRDILDNQKLE